MDGGNLVINAYDGSSNSGSILKNGIITCPHNGDCNVTCESADNACRGITLTAQTDTNILYAHGTGKRVFRSATFYCPYNFVPGFTNNCYVITVGTDNMKLADVKFYTLESFTDIYIYCPKNELDCWDTDDSDSAIKIWCGVDYSSNCKLKKGNTDSEWECKSNGDTCNTFSLPTYNPTSPTISPSDVPSAIPTAFPSEIPTYEPTHEPTVVPSYEPTVEPTAEPTIEPTVGPTDVPSFLPSDVPTFLPTYLPTKYPSVQPSVQPTLIPTATPSTSAFPTSFPNTALASDTMENNSDFGELIIFIGIVIFVLIVICMFCMIYYYYRKMHMKNLDQTLNLMRPNSVSVVSARYMNNQHSTPLPFIQHSETKPEDINEDEKKMPPMHILLQSASQVKIDDNKSQTASDSDDMYDDPLGANAVSLAKNATIGSYDSTVPGVDVDIDMAVNINIDVESDGSDSGLIVELVEDEDEDGMETIETIAGSFDEDVDGDGDGMKNIETIVGSIVDEDEYEDDGDSCFSPGSLSVIELMEIVKVGEKDTNDCIIVEESGESTTSSSDSHELSVGSETNGKSLK